VRIVESKKAHGTLRLNVHMETQFIDAALESTPTATGPGQRLRILHVVSCLGMGGTEHGVLKVINGLGDTQFEHQICVMRGLDHEFVQRMGVRARVLTVDSGKPGLQFPLFRLQKIMKEFKPHVVHSRNFGALEAIPAARMAGVPSVIHSEHGYEVEILKGLPLRRRILCGLFYAMADQIVAVTEDLSRYYARQSWHPSLRFRVIHNGVDTERFAPQPGLGASFRETFGIPADRIVIGSVGRLVPIKDHKTLLRAAGVLVKSGFDVHVLLVGSGPELPNLARMADQSSELAGRTLFLGASDRVHEVLNAFDIFVLPSISEGMSNTILEAMATGLPLVVTRTGGNPELVDDGRTGNLFDPQDVATLARLLAGLVEDTATRQRHGSAARARAVERFSLGSMIQQYRDLYSCFGSQPLALGKN
jgi:sugar transferase (PEP-CTERM/EpsH1 system associated)